MPFALLLAMQAAGMVVDYMGTKNQQELNDLGTKLQYAGIETNIEQTRLQTEDQTLQAMRQLRKNLGSQLAIFAARGTDSGAGSANLSIGESVSNFNEDQRMRKINQRARETDLRAGKTVAYLNNATQNAKLWQGFAQRTFNKFPTSQAGWDKAIQGFGMTSV